MEIAVMAGLFAKGDMEVDASHFSLWFIVYCLWFRNKTGSLFSY
jgi:hypothetical protein